MNNPGPGPGVDATGQAVVDPTRNVLDKVEDSVKRLDDLREQSERHTDTVAKMEAEHAKELRKLEADRIDAIRAVDVAASQQQQKDAEVRATSLAKQVSDTAEANRVQVAAAASAAATSLGAALVPIQERLAELTRLQYEQAGAKVAVVETSTTSRGQVAIFIAAAAVAASTVIGIAGVVVTFLLR